MSDIQHIDVDSDEFEGTPKALREYAKKLRKELETVSQERDGFRDQVTSSALSNVLTGFNNPSRVKADLLRDKVDPLDTEAVAEWIEANGDDYAKAEASPTPATPEQPSPQADAYQAFQPGGGYRPAGDLTKLDAVLAKLGPDATPEQTAAAIREAGI